MDLKPYITWLLAVFILNLPACTGQMNTNNHIQILPDRYPAVAGSFYPKQASQLKTVLQIAFDQSVQKSTENEVLAIISPHAGYVYSAKIAASAFNQIDSNSTFAHIFVIGSSHKYSFNGASIYSSGNFITPLGSIPIDPLAKELLNTGSLFNDNINAHSNEHCIEVQLPFLQYHLKKPFSIIPIVIGTQSEETCRSLAKQLKPHFKSGNLFIVSTDFSHYPSYKDAQYSDSAISDAIVSKSPKNVLTALEATKEKKIDGLLTSMCGWTSVLTLLYITNSEKNIKVRKIDYQNSGDISIGDKSRVVGYVAMSFEKQHDFLLTSSDKKELLKLARTTIAEYTTTHKILEIDTSNLSKNLSTEVGVFVTLYKKGELRGCIGTFKPHGPLYITLQDMVISASNRDSRFRPVIPDELKDIEIEISVLTPLKKIQSIEEIEIGKHGIYLVKGNKTGTLLPKVASEHHWTREEFLGYCARDKASLGWNGWKNADIYVYETVVFSEKEKN